MSVITTAVVWQQNKEQVVCSRNQISETERSKRKPNNNTDTMGNNDVAGLMKKIEQIEESISENNLNLKSTIRKIMVELNDDLVKSVERKNKVIECALHDALKEN